MKGKTHTKLTNQRSIEHQDPNSDRHKNDQLEFRKIRELRQATNWMEDSDSSYLLEEKFSSLGNGFIVAQNGDEIDSDDFTKIINDTLKNRYFYWAKNMNKNAKPGARRQVSKKNKKGAKVPLEPVKQLAVTFRPDHSLALHAIDQQLKEVAQKDIIRKLIKSTANECSKFFTRDTGYEILATTIHASEGCLHFHLIYATISDKNELLHLDRGDENGERKRGNPTRNYAGPCQVGLERMIRNNIPVPNEEYHKYLLKNKKRKGEYPLDVILSEIVDGAIEVFQIQYPKTRNFFENAYNKWKQQKTSKWKYDPSKNKKSIEEKIAYEKINIGGIEIER